MLIFDEDALWRLWDEHGSFRPAFVEWGERIIAAMDRRDPDPDEWIDLADITHALEQDGLTQVELLRALLVPHHKDGTTITQIAGATNLPVSTVVGALFTPRCERQFSRYVYGERWILEWGSTSSTKRMMRSTGLAEDAVRLLCERHKVHAARFAHEKSALRIEAEELLGQKWGVPKRVLEVLAERHPNEVLPSAVTLANWRARVA